MSLTLPYYIIRPHSGNEETKCGFKADNNNYHYYLSSRLLSNNLKIEIYKSIILCVVLNGCEAMVS